MLKKSLMLVSVVALAGCNHYTVTPHKTTSTSGAYCKSLQSKLNLNYYRTNIPKERVYPTTRARYMQEYRRYCTGE